MELEQLFKMFDGLVSQSAKKFAQSQQGVKHQNWKYCVALAKLGWEAYDFETIPSATEDDVLIKWRKEGKDDIQIKLCFTEQRLWIRYMREQKEKQDEANTEDRKKEE